MTRVTLIASLTSARESLDRALAELERDDTDLALCVAYVAMMKSSVQETEDILRAVLSNSLRIFTEGTP